VRHPPASAPRRASAAARQRTTVVPRAGPLTPAPPRRHMHIRLAHRHARQGERRGPPPGLAEGRALARRLRDAGGGRAGAPAAGAGAVAAAAPAVAQPAAVAAAERLLGAPCVPLLAAVSQGCFPGACWAVAVGSGRALAAGVAVARRHLWWPPECTGAGLPGSRQDVRHACRSPLRMRAGCCEAGRPRNSSQSGACCLPVPLQTPAIHRACFRPPRAAGGAQ